MATANSQHNVGKRTTGANANHAKKESKMRLGRGIWRVTMAGKLTHEANPTAFFPRLFCPVVFTKASIVVKWVIVKCGKTTNISDVFEESPIM